MSDINKLILVGRLTRDADISYTQGGSAVVKFSIASNHSMKRGDKWEDEASFFDVVYFGKPAEGLKPYLTKGKQVGIEAHLKQDRWQDKETGKQRSKISIVADVLQLLGGSGKQQGEKQDFQEDIPNDTAKGNEFNTPEDVPF